MTPVKLKVPVVFGTPLEAIKMASGVKRLAAWPDSDVRFGGTARHLEMVVERREWKGSQLPTGRLVDAHGVRI